MSLLWQSSCRSIKTKHLPFLWWFLGAFLLGCTQIQSLFVCLYKTVQWTSGRWDDPDSASPSPVQFSGNVSFINSNQSINQSINYQFKTVLIAVVYKVYSMLLLILLISTFNVPCDVHPHTCGFYCYNDHSPPSRKYSVSLHQNLSAPSSPSLPLSPDALPWQK